MKSPEMMDSAIATLRTLGFTIQSRDPEHKTVNMFCNDIESSPCITLMQSDNQETLLFKVQYILDRSICQVVCPTCSLWAHDSKPRWKFLGKCFTEVWYTGFYGDKAEPETSEYAAIFAGLEG